MFVSTTEMYNVRCELLWPRWIAFHQLFTCVAFDLRVVEDLSQTTGYLANRSLVVKDLNLSHCPNMVVAVLSHVTNKMGVNRFVLGTKICCLCTFNYCSVVQFTANGLEDGRMTKVKVPSTSPPYFLLSSPL